VDDRHSDNNTQLPKRKHCEKSVFVLGRVGNFAIWRRKEKLIIIKNPDQTPHQTIPLFFSPNSGCLRLDVGGRMWSLLLPCKSFLLPSFANRRSSSLSLSLSVSVSVSFPSHLLLFVATKDCSYIAVRREQIFLHVDSSFIR